MGSSRFGGCPDLPLSVRWPRDRHKHPLSFLLQVNLGALPALDPLPKAGLLSFFYDTLNTPDAAQGFAARSATAIYLPPGAGGPLFQRQALTDEDGPNTDTFDPVPLKPTLVPSFPDDLRLIPDPTLQGEYLSAIVNPERSIFKLLGHPNTIQNPMPIECAMIARGLDPTHRDLPRTMAARLLEEAEDWILLLQVDSSRDLELSWGDCGRLYYWIRRDHLRRRRFDKTILCLQSH